MDHHWLHCDNTGIDGPGNIAAEAMPEATPSASSKPISMNCAFGSANISLVTIPARNLMKRIEKYTSTYLQITNE
jgi:hypothetical protein